ncbi:NUDIX hydrolase [Chitinophaga cymbidii]|uniref:Nudix hydrolase domain-containing protein n=1 Tax=Chitinophaga cymbidii TaxID=1096750 RepID=A0A512RM80_9BACT|nr:NUDIX domain-containing protein [Chitinophaga cymbidii]GEP96806.1 hypothetical protein CCY01nite_30660 [Chitinophaga cymbidii]
METPVNIYINERPLVIADEHASLPTEYHNAPVYRAPDEKEISRIIDQLEKNELANAVFLDADPVSLFNRVKAHFTVFEAAGGLISNPAEEVLLMFRRGKWDLPKGKLDEGETLEACALREVQEETGLHNISLDGKITETFHYYPWKNKKVLKHSHWYRMRFTGTELTIPQIEEDIMDIQWIRPENLGKYMQYSYQNIIDVLLKAGYKL